MKKEPINILFDEFSISQIRSENIFKKRRNQVPKDEQEIKK